MPYYCWDGSTKCIHTLFVTICIISGHISAFTLHFCVLVCFFKGYYIPVWGLTHSMKIHTQNTLLKVENYVFYSVILCPIQEKTGTKHWWVDLAKLKVYQGYYSDFSGWLCSRSVLERHAQPQNILYVNADLSVATEEFQTVHMCLKAFGIVGRPQFKDQSSMSAFCIWCSRKQTLLQDNLGDPVLRRNRQNFLPWIIRGKNTAFSQRCLVLGPHIPLALGNKSDEARELSTWWSFLDLLAHSLGVVWCRLVSSTLCGPLGKNSPSTLNWVSRQWLCSPVSSSWNGFHMAGRETFPVGRTSANGSFCKGSAATLGTHPWAQCAPPSLARNSGAQSVCFPLYWPQLAFLTGANRVHKRGSGAALRVAVGGFEDLCTAAGTGRILFRHPVEHAVFDSCH